MGNRHEALCYLDDLFTDVDEAMASGDIANIAGVALDLAACNAAIMDRLEPLKKQLRDHARTMVDGGPPGTARIAGDMGGTVTVTFPSEQVKLSKECDIEYLKERMGLAFDDFFDVRTTYKPKGKQPWVRVATSFEGTPELLRDLMEAVELVEPTPRVGFKH